MKLDPRNIHYLLAIAKHGTFNGAARAEKISQPALSNKIALLERQLGVRVLDRGRHGATLNRYGQLLIRHARALDSVLEQALEEIDLEKRGLHGPLTIGGTPVALLELVPRAVSRLARSASRASISIIEGDDELLLDSLRSGEIELMLGSMGAASELPDIVQEKLIEFPMRAVVGAASPFWSRKVMALEELADAQWAMPAQGGIIRQHVEAVFLNSSIPFPRSYWSCSSMMALKALVQHNDCVAMVPASAIALETRAGVLRGIQLRNLSVSRTIAIMRQRNWPLSPLAERFIVLLREVAQRLR
jgi:DNA-binding transcriptional LysR family regulator